MTTATIENMRKYYREPKRVKQPNGQHVTIFPQQPVAYSPETGEEYSANPSDYWNAPAGWTMTDENGNPMLLVIPRHSMVDVAEA